MCTAATRRGSRRRRHGEAAAVFSALVPVVSSFLPSSTTADAVCRAEACRAAAVWPRCQRREASIEIADWWATTLRAAAAATTEGSALLRAGRVTREAFLLTPARLTRSEWEAHFGASTIAFSDEAFHDWILEQVCEGRAPPV